MADNVNKTIDIIKPTLQKVCRPIIESWTELDNEFGQKMHIEGAEFELGFSFDMEGNVYVAKATASTSIKIKLVLKPVQP